MGETSETVALAEGGDTFASQMSEMEKEASDLLNFFSVQMRVGESSGPTQMERESEIQERDEGIGSDSRPILSFVQRCSRSKDVASFQGVFSSIMSCRDGSYYNDHDIRHMRHGELGNYSYVQSASISSGNNPVQEDELADMVNNAMEHVLELLFHRMRSVVESYGYRANMIFM